MKTASPQWSALWGRLLHPVAFCFLRMPYGTLGTPWTLRGVMPSSMLCGILRVSRCHTEHQGHSVPDPRVTVWLPKSHFQEAGPGKGQRLLSAGNIWGRERRKKWQEDDSRVPTELMQLGHQAFVTPKASPLTPLTIEPSHSAGLCSAPSTTGLTLHWVSVLSSGVGR